MRLSEARIARYAAVRRAAGDCKASARAMAMKPKRKKDDPRSLPALAAKNDIQGVMEQVNAGVPIDERDSVGNTPLIMAARNGYEELVKFLISKKANVNAATDKSISSARGSTALICAARNGHFSILKQLMKAGAKVNAETTWHESALFEAVQREDAKMVEYLLSKGAKPTAPTAFMAIKCRKAKILCLLLEAGVDPNSTEAKTKGSLLGNAITFQNDIAFVLPLLEKGASPNQLSGLRYPLSFAASKGNLEICKLLIAHGADINRQDTFESVPLMDAASRGHGKVVEFLLSQGADARLRDNEGKTAWDIAREAGHSALGKFLS